MVVYGAESWSMKEIERNRLPAGEMKFLSERVRKVTI